MYIARTDVLHNLCIMVFDSVEFYDQYFFIFTL